MDLLIHTKKLFFTQLSKSDNKNILLPATYLVIQLPSLRLLKFKLPLNSETANLRKYFNPHQIVLFKFIPDNTLNSRPILVSCKINRYICSTLYDLTTHVHRQCYSIS